MLLCPTSESPPKRHSAICSLVTNPLDNHAVHMSLPDLIFDLVFVAKILGWYWKIRLGSMQNHTHPVCSDRFVSPIIIVIIYIYICGCISYVCSLCCQLSRRISLYIYRNQENIPDKDNLHEPISSLSVCLPILPK